MQISCNAVQDLVVLYHEDSLSPATKAEVENHLRECKICSGFYRAYHKMNQRKTPPRDFSSGEAPEFTALAKKLKRERITHRSLWTIGIIAGTILGWEISNLLPSSKK